MNTKPNTKGKYSIRNVGLNGRRMKYDIHLCYLLLMQVTRKLNLLEEDLEFYISLKAVTKIYSTFEHDLEIKRIT